MTQLSIKQIRLDGGTQPRAQLDLIVIAEYAEAMKAGESFPPVTVFYDGSDYWLADGFHRVKAAEMIGDGLAVIEADVRQGAHRDAILYACGANAEHGLRRTNADKRRVVETLLQDSEWSAWSNAEIARRCSVDEKTVRTLRAELFPDAVGAGLAPAPHRATIGVVSSENPKIDVPPAAPSVKGQDMTDARATAQRVEQTRTVQRSGKSYKMKTSKIGKQKPSKKMPAANKTQIAGKAVTPSWQTSTSAACPLCKEEPGSYNRDPDGVYRCGNCGAKVVIAVSITQASTCPTCDKPVAVGVAFCGNCGAILEKGK